MKGCILWRFLQQTRLDIKIDLPLSHPTIWSYNVEIDPNQTWFVNYGKLYDLL